MPKLDQITQKSPQWLAERAKRITSTDIAKLFGSERDYDSVVERLRSPDTPRPSFQNEAMFYGVQNEERALCLARAWFWPSLELEEGGFWVHPEYDWLAASPDGILSEIQLVEIKCPQRDPPKDVYDFPISYYLQVQTQMYVTGIRKASLVYWKRESAHYAPSSDMIHAGWQQAFGGGFRDRLFRYDICYDPRLWEWLIKYLKIVYTEKPKYNDLYVKLHRGHIKRSMFVSVTRSHDIIHSGPFKGEPESPWPKTYVESPSSLS